LPEIAPRKAVPLHALTLKDLEKLKQTNEKQVRNCAYEIDNTKPRDFDVCLSKVVKHNRDQNREKSQQNQQKKKSIKEVPPKSK
jgi:hypothetical protein